MIYRSEDTCICCGEVIPEGRQVCFLCEHGKLIEYGETLRKGFDEGIKNDKCNNILKDRCKRLFEGLSNVDLWKMHETLSEAFQVLIEIFKKELNPRQYGAYLLSRHHTKSIPVCAYVRAAKRGLPYHRHTYGG